MKTDSIPWTKIAAEGALIIVSVLVAISLESAWQARQNQKNARTSLVEVLNELEADRAFLADVRTSQRSLQPPAALLLEWLADPGQPSTAQIDSALRDFDSPLSMWPRRSAWSSMVAANQLGLLRDPDLVSELGEYYYFHQERIVEGSRDYDEEFSRLHFEAIPRFRNLDERAAQTISLDEYRVLRNQVLRLREWNDWYLRTLDVYEANLEGVLASVRTYLAQHGKLE